jgi:hypothetical protein
MYGFYMNLILGIAFLIFACTFENLALGVIFSFVSGLFLGYYFFEKFVGADK